jgi:hypothetical protein
MTRNDVLNHNVDLIGRACEILAGKPHQRLAASYKKLTDGSLDVTVTTSNVGSVEVLLDGRPVDASDVRDGPTSFRVAAPFRPGELPSASVLECRGFRGTELVASTRVQLGRLRSVSALDTAGTSSRTHSRVRTLERVTR